MRSLFLTSLLAAFNLPLSVVAAASRCRAHSPANSIERDALATGWYPGWLGNKFPPSNISWSKYNTLTFAFATTVSTDDMITLDPTSAALLPDFVKEAHAHGVNATCSIGGWSGSRYFSTAVTSENRTAFVKACVNLVRQYNLDGLDFDWEFPNHQGIGCNTISPDDSASFLAFLQELRKDPVGARIMVSTTAGGTPFAGPDGKPIADVSAYAGVLDYVAIMNYDIWGSWSTSVGPNAPLNDTCAAVKAGSAVSAVNAWTAAKFPACQIALGVAAYGHSYRVTPSNALNKSGSLVAYPPFNHSDPPLGDTDVAGGATTLDECGNPSGVSGTFAFQSLITGGFLNKNGTAAPGIDYRFDSCSETPYVYNPTTEVMISYDDATSFADKGNFIKNQHLRGFALWDISDDYNNILVDSISKAMGTSQVCS